MKLDTKQIIEIFSVLAVVVSLLILAYELRESNQLAMTATRLEITNSYASLNESIYSDPAFAELAAKLRDPNFEPDIVEAEQVQAYLMRHVNIWVAIENAYNNGHFSETNFQSTHDDIKSNIESWPGMHRFWFAFFEMYPTLSTNYQVFSYAQELLRPNDN